MPRVKRLVVPGVPHHVTQRGNQGQQVFFDEKDGQHYIDDLKDYAARAETKILAFCLMPNHIHLILEPAHEDGLRAALAPVHHRHAMRLNKRDAGGGHIWQGRFHSNAMDESSTFAVKRYVELNPVRSNLVNKPEAWRWSSAKHHLGLEHLDFISPSQFDWPVDKWRAFLAEGISEQELAYIRKTEMSHRVMGNDKFIDQLERQTGLNLRPAKRGRPPKHQS